MIEIDCLIKCESKEKANLDRLMALKNITYITDTSIIKTGTNNIYVENNRKNGFYECKKKKRNKEINLSYSQKKSIESEMELYKTELDKIFKKSVIDKNTVTKTIIPNVNNNFKINDNINNNNNDTSNIIKVKDKKQKKIKSKINTILSEDEKDKIANKEFFLIFCMVLFIKLFIY